MDNFIDMLPEKFIASNEKAKTEGYFAFEENDNKIEIKVSEQGAKFFANIPVIAAILAGQYDIIIDEVLLDEKTLKGYITKLISSKVYFIGVYCSLEEMEKREKARGDRMIGLSRGQIDIVHHNIPHYDLKIDTTNMPANLAAIEILKFIAQEPEPKAFIKIRDEYNI